MDLPKELDAAICRLVKLAFEWGMCANIPGLSDADLRSKCREAHRQLEHEIVGHMAGRFKHSHRDTTDWTKIYDLAYTFIGPNRSRAEEIADVFYANGFRIERK